MGNYPNCSHGNLFFPCKAHGTLGPSEVASHWWGIYSNSSDSSVFSQHGSIWQRFSSPSAQAWAATQAPSSWQKLMKHRLNHYCHQFKTDPTKCSFLQYIRGNFTVMNSYSWKADIVGLFIPKQVEKIILNEICLSFPLPKLFIILFCRRCCKWQKAGWSVGCNL